MVSGRRASAAFPLKQLVSPTISLTLDRVVSSDASPRLESADAPPARLEFLRRCWTEPTPAQAAMAAMTLIAGLTLPTLGRQALSWDEAVSASSAQRSFPHLAEMLAHTDAPLGFYYLLLHGWVSFGQVLGISGDNAWWLRLPSAAAAIAAVGVLVVLVSRFFDPRTALVAGLLFAAHPMVTYYAQDARPYTLVTLGLLVSTALLLRALEKPNTLTLTGYVFASSVTLYLHLFAIFAFAGHVYLIRARGRPRWRWGLVAAVIVGAITPLVVLAHRQTAELGWIPRPSVATVWSVLTHLAGGVPFTVAVLAAAAWMVAIRRVKFAMTTRVLLCATLIPPAALVVADFVSPDLVARYALVAIPAGVTLLALAAARSRSRVVAVLVAVAGLCSLGATTVQLTHSYKYENYRAAADTMGDLAKPGSSVVFLPISGREGYDIYDHLEPDLRNISDVTLKPHSGPAATSHIGGLDLAPAQISARLSGASTVFLLGDTVATADRTLHDPASVAQENMLARYHPVLVRHYGDLTLTVLVPDNAA
jgi:mannosyltransferase